MTNPDSSPATDEIAPRNRHAPQGFSDWLGIAGFAIAVVTLSIQVIDHWRDRASLAVTGIARQNPLLAPLTFTLEYKPASNDRVDWSFDRNGNATARVNGNPVPIRATINGKPLGLVTAVVVNQGRRPLRLVSATVTYTNPARAIHQETRELDYLLTEEQRRAVIDIWPQTAAGHAFPVMVAVLDELGDCHAANIETDFAVRFGGPLKDFPKKRWCVDPEIERRINVP